MKFAVLKKMEFYKSLIYQNLHDFKINLSLAKFSTTCI